MNHQPQQPNKQAKRNFLLLIVIAVVAAIIGTYNYVTTQVTAKHQIDTALSQATSKQKTSVQAANTAVTSQDTTASTSEQSPIATVPNYKTIVLGSDQDAFGQVIHNPQENSLDVDQAVVQVTSRPFIDIYIEAYEKYLAPKYRQSIPYDNGNLEELNTAITTCDKQAKMVAAQESQAVDTHTPVSITNSTERTKSSDSNKAIAPDSVDTSSEMATSNCGNLPIVLPTPDSQNTGVQNSNNQESNATSLQSEQVTNTNNSNNSGNTTISTTNTTSETTASAPTTKVTTTTVNNPVTTGNTSTTNNTSVSINTSVTPTVPQQTTVTPPVSQTVTNNQYPVGTKGTKVAPVFNLNQKLNQSAGQITDQVTTSDSNITNTPQPTITAVNPEAPVPDFTVIGPQPTDTTSSDSVDPNGVVDIYRFNLPYTNVPFINQYFQQQLLDASAGKETTELKVTLPNTKIVPSISDIYQQVNVLASNQLPIPVFKYHDLLHAPNYYNTWNNNYKEKHDIFFFGQIKNVAVFENISFYYPSGASHGIFSIDYYNFDLVHKQEITDQMLVPEANRSALVQLLYKKLLTYIRNNFVSNQDRTISDSELTAKYAYDITQDQMYVSPVFYFDKTGITFIYQGIDIVGKAFTSPVDLTINYADLVGIVPDQYLNLR